MAAFYRAQTIGVGIEGRKSSPGNFDPDYMIGVIEGTGEGVARIEVGDGMGERKGVTVGNGIGVPVAMGVVLVGAGVGDELPRGGSVGAGVPAVGVGGIGMIDGTGVGVPGPETGVAVGTTGLVMVLEFLQEPTAKASTSRNETASRSRLVRRTIFISPPSPCWTPQGPGGLHSGCAGRGCDRSSNPRAERPAIPKSLPSPPLREHWAVAVQALRRTTLRSTCPPAA